MFKGLFLNAEELQDLPIRDLTKEIDYYNDILKCNLSNTERFRITNYLKLLYEEIERKFNYLRNKGRRNKMKILNLVEANEIRLVDETSFHDGRILASYDDLTNLFGVSTDGDDEYKIYCEWVLQFDDIVFTIYDWKGSSNPKENSNKKYIWHIGTHTKLGTMKVLDILEQEYQIERITK